MSQTEVIASILRREGKIDNFYCIHNKISLRLGARIFDLRKKGWKIRAEEQDDKNCVYFLESEPQKFFEKIISQPALFTRAQI